MNNSTDLQYIYWFAHYSTDSSSVRYRAYYPLQYLSKNKSVKYRLVIPGHNLKSIFDFALVYLSALLFRKRNSIIVIQKVHSNFIYARLLKLLVRVHKKNTYYDIDDADYLEHPAKTIFFFIRKCSGVIIGSRELQKNLGKLNSNIILNTSPVPELGISKKQKNEILTIGWIGDFSGEHRTSMMEDFFPALQNSELKIKLILTGVGRKFPDDRKMLLDLFAQEKNIEIEIPENINWQDEKWIQEQIIRFDIGIATLKDSELHRSKSAFKLKQYLNNGVPVLSTNLPENQYFIRDGENGFLCKSPDEFKEKLRYFAEMDAAAYEQFSKNALQCKPEFSPENYGLVLLNLNKNTGIFQV